jgi:hypothetical protein
MDFYREKKWKKKKKRRKKMTKRKEKDETKEYPKSGFSGWVRYTN